jgi:hypothetical protein
VQTDTGLCSGLYDALEYSGNILMSDIGGIPHVGSLEETIGLACAYS